LQAQPFLSAVVAFNLEIELSQSKLVIKKKTFHFMKNHLFEIKDDQKVISESLCQKFWLFSPINPKANRVGDIGSVRG
jgi:hypothetical protein